ncbi:MAG: hypothetical protein P1S60_18550, partial [Anaerolineae bacterium]|nr:hypothetical protein [Anaerolineae bacterium]
RVGKSRVAVVNMMRLLDGAPAVQQMLLDKHISEGHGRALLGLSEHSKQEAALEVVISKGMSVRETESLVRRWRLADEGEFSDQVKYALIEGSISETHGEILGRLDVARQADALHIVVSKQLTIEETEALVQALSVNVPQQAAEKTDASPSPEIKAIEQRFEEALGTRVRLRNGKKGGNLVIYYYSDEEFQTLYERLVGENY